MDKKTVGIIATVVTALVCGCTSLFTCIWGILIATGSPINTTVGDVHSVQTFPPTVGYVLLCLTVLLILVPVAVGFFTLRKKPEDAVVAPSSDEPLPPTS